MHDATIRQPAIDAGSVLTLGPDGVVELVSGNLCLPADAPGEHQSAPDLVVLNGTGARASRVVDLL